MNKLLNFAKNEDGAVTVDWVVLSAIVIGLGMVVLVPVAFSTQSSTKVVSEQIKTQPVGYGNN
jgi:Flp pilus assembly pilin Flp